MQSFRYRHGDYLYEAVPGATVYAAWGVARLRARIRILGWRFWWKWDRIVSVHDTFGEADDAAKRAPHE